MLNIKKLIAASVLIFGINGILLAHADAPQGGTVPGSVDDPVITKSYFDQNIANKIADELAKQTFNEEKIRQIIASELAKTGSAPSSGTGDSTHPAVSNSGLTVIKLEQGQLLFGGAGAEIIVRTGKAVAFSSTADGIADVTAGKDITAGTSVELNHLLIVPREGRGIKPDPKSNQDIYVMVRGNYLLTNADGSKVTP
ncbi:hypothetical protein [Paenibacillus sp. Pae108]|uniref:hypothetical protein n=1 Tax=Paenibacillus sp. Pae108 TaxID=2926019 RepID=UPI0021177702|nr:hypothetical protein [Paenibacillus sp. Pae108]